MTDSVTQITGKSGSRLAGLDAARVLATLGIVWVHVAEIQGQPEEFVTLGRFGTSFYTLAALFLSSRSFLLGKNITASRIVLRRAKRLLVPYVLWCVLYGIFYFGTMYSQGYSVQEITRYWGPLFGTAVHLWFLPFAFVAGAIATYVVPRLLRLPGWFLLTGGPVATVSVYVFVYGWGYASLDLAEIAADHLQRLDRWVEEAPLVCAALFGLSVYGKYLRKIGRLGRRRRHQLAFVAVVAFFLTQACYAIFLDQLSAVFWTHGRIIANLAGVFWLVAFMAARDGRWIQKLAPLGKATYFTYLSHQMIIDSVKAQFVRLPGYGSLVVALLSTVAIYLAAVALALLVSRVRLLRWLSP